MHCCKSKWMNTLSLFCLCIQENIVPFRGVQIEHICLVDYPVVGGIHRWKVLGRQRCHNAKIWCDSSCIRKICTRAPNCGCIAEYGQVVQFQPNVFGTVQRFEQTRRWKWWRSGTERSIFHRFPAKHHADCSDIPNTFPHGIPLLEQGQNKWVTMGQKQLLTLVSASFLCIFMDQPAGYPSINMNTLFQLRSNVSIEMLRRTTNYYIYICIRRWTRNRIISLFAVLSSYWSCFGICAVNAIV